jgi:nicotinamide mononucleotide (NMN) deamidase PncC
MSSENTVDSATSEFPPPTLKQLANQVASLLNSRKETVSVAETTSGGLVSAALLSVPGASAYYKGGLMLYTRESRIAYGGWTEETLKTYT